MSKSTVKQFEDDLEARINADKLPTANIIVAGITGTGKSTLINAVFGSEMAATGIGEPVTDEIYEYSKDDIPICIWDTVGLELDAEKTRQSIKNIRETISAKSILEDPFSVIHAIWYCINSGSHKYQGAELEFIKELHDLGLPFIIVLTQCSAAEDEINAFEKEIKRINLSMGMDDIEIVQVLALPVKCRGGYPIPAFGLDDLVRTTLNLLPQFIKSGFAAAQKVSKIEKRKISEDIIFDYVKAAEDGFWDKIPLINVFTSDNKILNMYKKITCIYNTKFPEKFLKETIEKLGGIKADIGYKALISPFNKEYNIKLNVLFEEKKKVEGYKIDYSTIPVNKRAARLVAYYGYLFIEILEDLWEKLTVEQLDDIDRVTTEIRNSINEKLSQK